MPDGFGAIDLAVAIAQNGRRFMVTQAGRMGLIPKHAKEGDVVAILIGCRVPIILRSVAGYYSVIGDAYVQGMMDGEAKDEIKELRNIELH